MQIEVKVSEPINFKYGEKEYVLRRPKVGSVREMSKRLKQEGADQLLIMIEFCVSCGVPQEVVDDWDASQLASFLKQLSSDEEKKSSPKTT